MPRDKLFVTDDGSGGWGWLVCCEDYGRKTLAVEPSVVDWARRMGALAGRLQDGRAGRELPEICAACDRKGQGEVHFDHTPALVGSPFWPYRSDPVIPAGRRLVVLACNAEWAEHAAAILDGIDQLSTMPGETLVVWNDAQTRPPAELTSHPGRLLWDYREPLGWQGISRGLGQAYRFALDCGYDWVIKLDTDTCLLRRGWDALLCGACPRDAQAGTMMDIARQGVIPKEIKHPGGLYTRQLERLRWARGLVRQKRRRWAHIQGGCYVVGAEALRRIEDLIGLDAEDQDALPEAHDNEGCSRVGEDVYFDSKCRVARVRQVGTPLVSSWWVSGQFRDKPPDDAKMEHLRILRDNEGCAAAHPIKHLPTMRLLMEEAANA